ncbi:large ribosomal RNA subunit accumulation protein YCED homolog 2, chloroplastic [Tripterygium wilfordii]|uniref:large ribosomal RNA subunit accumulation protein YCED homolog 2, chloroplastic n=1 Tax=Tripterygium wilfordii TaxID=458696 RepID=UPI0018F7F704|nr:large ribosomal RNA subunit accumulation protein YCED homolog 2, chloroplastic [Tripterygium wilfordii]
MAKVAHLVSQRSFNPIPFPSTPNSNTLKSPFPTPKITASSRKHDLSMMTKKSSRSTPRRLIKISTSDGKWQGNWSRDYLVTLQELRLGDLVEDEQHKDAEVLINLCIQKHASFGLSVDGRIITSFTRKCSYCSNPYCREIDTNFNVWVLPSSNRTIQLPEIGVDDPSVIYVKPGFEADLDSLVQDTIRLTTSSKDTCSESCEKSEPKLQYIGVKKAASIDKRWSRLLEWRKANP